MSTSELHQECPHCINNTLRSISNICAARQQLHSIKKPCTASTTPHKASTLHISHCINCNCNAFTNLALHQQHPNCMNYTFHRVNRCSYLTYGFRNVYYHNGLVRNVLVSKRVSALKVLLSKRVGVHNVLVSKHNVHNVLKYPCSKRKIL